MIFGAQNPPRIFVNTFETFNNPFAQTFSTTIFNRSAWNPNRQWIALTQNPQLRISWVRVELHYSLIISMTSLLFSFFLTSDFYRVDILQHWIRLFISISDRFYFLKVPDQSFILVHSNLSFRAKLIFYAHNPPKIYVSIAEAFLTKICPLFAWLFLTQPAWVLNR